MHYCAGNTPDDSPQSYMMNIHGAGSDSCFHHQPSKSYESFDYYNVDNAPINNYVIEGSLLHSKGHGKSTVEASLPYSVSPPNPCKQTIDPSKDTVHRSPGLNQMPWPAVPSFCSDFNFPVLDFVSGAPGPSWSSLGPEDDYMRQYLSASREGKRPSSRRLTEPRTRRIEFKKSRLNPEASCPPLKVRKEKLGGRIAALQQLVAPYGKTDTASVLSEAIGYIKFLLDQVEALSLPYTTKLSRVWADQKSRGGLGEESSGSKGELRRQGLCLVPSTCLSHIDFANCGGPLFNWPFPRVG